MCAEIGADRHHHQRRAGRHQTGEVEGREPCVSLTEGRSSYDDRRYECNSARRVWAFAAITYGRRSRVAASTTV